MKELTKTQTTTVESMVKSGKSYSAISGAMIALDFVANQKEADEVLEKMGVEKGRKANLTDQMYSYLQAEPRTQADFFKWIKTNGSENTWRWRSSHDKVRELTVRLHIELGGKKFTEKAYTEAAPKAEPKSAEAKPAKARGGRRQPAKKQTPPVVDRKTI